MPDSADAGVLDAGALDAALPPAETCPGAESTPVKGDVNGDGVVDVADTMALENHLFRGGRAPVCPEAADMNADGKVEADDAVRITSYLSAGTQHPTPLVEGSCASTLPWPEGQCAPLEFIFSGPTRVTGSAIATQLAIRSPTLAVQAWSTGLVATGCTITRVSTSHTVAAEVWDDPPGLRHLGYTGTATVSGGAVTYVIMSFVEDVFLPKTEGPTPVLAIEATADVPASGCAPCTIALDSTLVWTGQPVETVISADGRAYRPAAASTTIDVCR